MRADRNGFRPSFPRDDMKLRAPGLIRLIAALLAGVLWCWLRTCRLRVVSLDGKVHPADPSQERFLYAFWHEGLLGPMKLQAPIKMLISLHADGELIAQVAGWLGFGTIRGSTSKGGCQALLEMIRTQDEAVHLGITPDGPRGPRRVLQRGAVLVAASTGLPIVPVGVAYSRCWRFKSWDRFGVPYPFSTLVGVVGVPIKVPDDIDRQGMDAWRDLVENRLLETTHLAEEWANRIAREGLKAPPPHVEVAVAQPAPLAKSA